MLDAFLGKNKYLRELYFLFVCVFTCCINYRKCVCTYYNNNDDNIFLLIELPVNFKGFFYL